MSQAAPLPSLFGRFTALLKDHEHLGSTLRRLRAMAAALERDPARLPAELSPPELLSELKTELARHFAAEEAEDYFGTVLEEEPNLADDVAALKSEHHTMLTSVDALAASSQTEQRWGELALPTLALIAQLERHEAAETKLLRGLFKRGV